MARDEDSAASERSGRNRRRLLGRMLAGVDGQSKSNRRRLLGAATALGAGGLLSILAPTLGWARPASEPATLGTRTQDTQRAKVGQIHELHPGVFFISGGDPVSGFEDPNYASIVAVHAGTTLYLLDSGLGPEQKQAILDIAGRLRGQFTQLVLLSSHGHYDHTGNNDVIEEIEAVTKHHYISELSRPYWDPDVFTIFRDMYNEGARYFDYLQGLDLTIEDVLPFLMQAGLDPHSDPAQLIDVARRINQIGLTQVISHFWGDLRMRNVIEIYPPLHPSRETMTWFETLPRETFRYGAAQWTGWRVGDICVFEGHGHTADSLVFYVPAHKFLFFADETTPIPIWKDTNTDNSARSFHNALAMVDAGAVETLAAAHNPKEVITGSDAIRGTFTSLLKTKLDFEIEVAEAVAQFPDGVAIDDLYTYLRGQPQSLAAQFPQFPRGSTHFLKLTLLNFCRQHFTETQDGGGRPEFR